MSLARLGFCMRVARVGVVRWASWVGPGDHVVREEREAERERERWCNMLGLGFSLDGGMVREDGVWLDG